MLCYQKQFRETDISVCVEHGGNDYHISFSPRFFWPDNAPLLMKVSTLDKSKKQEIRKDVKRVYIRDIRGFDILI